MAIKGVLCVVSVLLFLSGCKPVYEDKYTFIPPKGRDAGLCANRCVVQKDACVQKCLDRGSVLDFGNKVISTFSGNSDSEDGKSSKDCTAGCDESHRICHTNCGGEVRVDKVCTAYCGKTKN